MSDNINNNTVDALTSTLSKSNLNKDPTEPSFTNNPLYKSSASQQEKAPDSQQEKAPDSEQPEEEEQPEKEQTKRGRASPKRKLCKKNSETCSNNNNNTGKATKDDRDDSDKGDSSSTSSLASDSEDEQIPKKKLKLKRCYYKEDEAEVSSSGENELVFSDLDDEENKEPEKKEKPKRCKTYGCVLLAVKERKYCSGCGRSRREKKARAFRRENRRIEEAEYELHYKYQCKLIKERQAKQRKKLLEKRDAIKKRFGKK